MIIITNIFSYNLQNYHQIYIIYHLNKRLSEKIIHTYETWEISSEAIIYCFIFFSFSNIFICCLEDEDFIIIAEIKELRLNIKILKSRMQFPLKMHEVFGLTIDNLDKFKIVLFDPLTSKNWQLITLLLVYTLHHVFLALFIVMFLKCTFIDI